MSSRYWGKILIKLLNLTNNVYNLNSNGSKTEKKKKKEEKLKHVGGNSRGYTDRMRQGTQGMLTRAVRKHLRYVGTWAREHAKHGSTWAGKHARNVGTWACKHGARVGTWAFKHAKHVGTLTLEHVSTQGTLVREDVSTQDTLACEHVTTQVNFAKFLRTPFLQNTSGQLFLPLVNKFPLFFNQNIVEQTSLQKHVGMFLDS